MMRASSARRRPALHWLALLACAAASAPELAAQVSEQQVGAGIRFERYTFASPERVDIERLTLVTVPVSGRDWLTPQLEIAISGAYAEGTLRRRDGRESTLAGLIDTEVRLTASLAADRLRLTALALVPTGASQLRADQMDVAGIVAADVLPFAISNWGTGGGFGLSAAAALPVSDATALGFSAGYVVAREYEPINTTAFAYRPGNQLHLRAAVDRTFGASKAALQLTYLHHGRDELAGANLYQPGDRLQAVGSFSFAAGRRASGLLYAGYLRRQRGEYTEIVQLTPAQDLVYGGAALRQPVGRRLVLVPSADARLLGNDDGIDQGYAASLGAGVEVSVGNFEIVPLARARFGRLTVRSAQESSLTGMELGITLRNRRVSR